MNVVPAHCEHLGYVFLLYIRSTASVFTTWFAYGICTYSALLSSNVVLPPLRQCPSHNSNFFLHMSCTLASSMYTVGLPPDNIHVTVIFTSFSSKLQLISTSIPSGIFVYVQRVDIFKRQFSSINHKVVCLTPILYNSSLPPPHKASIFSVVNPFLRSFISVLMPLKSSALIHQNFFVSIVLCNIVSMIHNVVIAVDHPFVVSGGSGQISRKEGVFQSKGKSKRR